MVSEPEYELIVTFLKEVDWQLAHFFFLDDLGSWVLDVDDLHVPDDLAESGAVRYLFQLILAELGLKPF
jgi:hypothetical protein